MSRRTAIAAIVLAGCGQPAQPKLDQDASDSASSSTGDSTDDMTSNSADGSIAVDERGGSSGTVGDGSTTGSDAMGESGHSSGSNDGGAACGRAFGGGPATMTTMHIDIGVHDPSMIWDGNRYYLFGTNSLAVRSSSDLIAWGNAGNYFGAVPGWVTAATTATGLWAPDISYFSGAFHVYYAGSTFGSNTSVIGLTTTTTLSAPSWSDQGLVIQTKPPDNFNAIDPNVAFDQACQPWLAFGSFWSGIKMRKLDAATGKLAVDDTTLYALASRNGGAIEAPSIISHNGYYYLFVSFDACCQGTRSTYRTMVGRATNITGPYTDKAGAGMMQGAAEQLLATSGRYIGPGGGTAWKDGDAYLYAYHYYDGLSNGASKLEIRPIDFDASDWITLGSPLFQ
ncbi:MAG: arabinan endo-1,5-alpha-L-arabinosidase [Myxococcota bacterium]|nr:arabinan endo-1,5-alpha-L-arabinosidase [Myxococcota bacterium]